MILVKSGSISLHFSFTWQKFLIVQVIFFTGVTFPHRWLKILLMHLHYKVPIWTMSKKTRKYIQQYLEMHHFILNIKARMETFLIIFWRITFLDSVCQRPAWPDPARKCWKLRVSLMYACVVQGWRVSFEATSKCQIIWFPKKIAKILWRRTQSRERGRSGVNRKHIKIRAKEENSLKYGDNTDWHAPTHVRFTPSTSIMARTLLLVKTRAIYNLPDIWDILYFTTGNLGFYIDHFSRLGPGQDDKEE